MINIYKSDIPIFESKAFKHRDFIFNWTTEEHFVFKLAHMIFPHNLQWCFLLV